MSWKSALWTVATFAIHCVAIVCGFLGLVHGVAAVASIPWLLLDFSKAGAITVAYYALLSLFWGGLCFALVVITNASSSRTA